MRVFSVFLILTGFACENVPELKPFNLPPMSPSTQQIPDPKAKIILLHAIKKGELSRLETRAVADENCKNGFQTNSRHHSNISYLSHNNLIKLENFDRAKIRHRVLLKYADTEDNKELHALDIPLTDYKIVGPNNQTIMTSFEALLTTNAHTDLMTSYTSADVFEASTATISGSGRNVYVTGTSGYTKQNDGSLTSNDPGGFSRCRPVNGRSWRASTGMYNYAATIGEGAGVWASSDATKTVSCGEERWIQLICVSWIDEKDIPMIPADSGTQ